MTWDSSYHDNVLLALPANSNPDALLVRNRKAGNTNSVITKPKQDRDEATSSNKRSIDEELDEDEIESHGIDDPLT